MMQDISSIDNIERLWSNLKILSGADDAPNSYAVQGCEAIRRLNHARGKIRACDIRTVKSEVHGTLPKTRSHLEYSLACQLPEETQDKWILHRYRRFESHAYVYR